MRKKWEKAFFSTNWKKTGVAVVTINNWIAANAEFLWEVKGHWTRKNDECQDNENYSHFFTARSQWWQSVLEKANLNHPERWGWMLWVPMVIMLVVTLVALTLTIVSKTQLRIYKNVRARKGLTNDYLSSIIDNIIMYLSSIVDKNSY